MIAKNPASMTSRLVTLFALVAVVTFSAVGTYLYHSLYVQLERRDDEELIGKSRSIDHLIQEANSIERIKANKHAMLDTISGHDQLLVLITDSAGATILKNYEGPAEEGFPLFNSLKTAQFNTLQSFILGGNSARFIASRPTTSTGEKTLVVVARTASDRMELLADYRTEVWYAAAIGTLLATILSFFLVRSGLQPLRLMAAQTHAVSANRLDTRLDIRSAPKELHDIVESFNAMLDRLHRSFEQLTQFSADLAHDLRTPLNNLMVQTQVALGKQRSVEEYQGLLSSNIEEYERLARMMESMLFLARAENAHVAVKIQALSVEDELAKISDYFEGIAEDARVKIVVGGTGEIFADPMLLRRALGNLIANAIRYTPAERTIRVEATDIGDVTILTVSNPGEGIPAEVVGRIFDRFYRADPSRSSSSGSSGLGLAIVRSIMTLHGGEAAVKSIQGERTIFSLTFPKEAKSKCAKSA
ncbi:heavy metal sensor histidine kinase [Herbaspirillum huttiense]|uniref:heavy metal sensor histidine kinase n=1 Tax=Herbaspirillum huttiense TaxID=863372 RepID=UPI0038780044